jgi:hypothetical protein
MPEIGVQVIQPHGVQSIGLVTDNVTGITMILHFGSGVWEPVAGIQRATGAPMPIPAGFTLDTSIRRRLFEMQAAVKDESITRGCGIALSTAGGSVVTT